MNRNHAMPDELETRVVASLTQMLDKYHLIDRLADEMLASEKSVDSLDESMIQLKQERESIEKMQTESLPLNQQYRESRQHASEAVHQLTNQIAGLIQGLLVKIGTLEQQTKRSCEQLKPQIQTGVRAIQMKNAYQQYN